MTTTPRSSQMRIALFEESLQVCFDLLRIVGPIGYDLGVVVLANNQQLVAVINFISKFPRRRFQLLDVGANRQGVVDQQHNARGREVRRKILDRLFDTIVEERNVFGSYRGSSAVSSGRDYIQGT